MSKEIRETISIRIDNEFDDRGYMKFELDTYRDEEGHERYAVAIAHKYPLPKEPGDTEVGYEFHHLHLYGEQAKVFYEFLTRITSY